MRYTLPESVEKVLARRERVRRRRERRRLSLFSLGLCSVLLLLTLRLASGPPTVPDSNGASAMGSFLLRADIGGFIAAVALAFLLGVLVTLFCARKKSGSTPEKPNQQRNHKTDGGKDHE